MSFVACFLGPRDLDERGYDTRFWEELQFLHDVDTAKWDPAVSCDLRSPEFCFSFHGTALFPVGLHPAAQRASRRFAFPAIVFNPHFQFEILRDEGRFEHWKTVIRAKDTALSGPNPYLVDHGSGPGWLQYTNYARETCPLEVKQVTPAVHARIDESDIHAPEIEPRVYEELHDEFTKFVDRSEFPCIGAKAVVRHKELTFAVYPTIAGLRSSLALASDLKAFVGNLMPPTISAHSLSKSHASA